MLGSARPGGGRLTSLSLLLPGCHCKLLVRGVWEEEAPQLGWDTCLSPLAAAPCEGAVGVKPLLSLSLQLQSCVPESLLHVAECVRELLLFLVWSCLLPLLEGLAAALRHGWDHWADSCK